MNRNIQIVVVLILSAMVSATVSRLSSSNPGNVEDDPTFSSVMSSRVFRCGYFVYPPGVIKNPNTGAMSGIYVDVLTSAVARLGLKLEWTKEVDFTTMVQDLSDRKVDGICAMIWPNASRAPFVEYSVPLFYSGVGMYVRADVSTALSTQEINVSTFKLATIDGEMTEIISRQDYPDATRISLPQNTDISQLLLLVSEGKADATFVEPYIASQFEKAHPGVLKNLARQHPIRVFGNTLMFRKGAFKTKSMFDTALNEELQSGAVERSIERYPGAANALYPVARPYVLPRD